MPANSWGSRFVVTSFGESHGEAMGVVIDGCPAGVPFDRELLLHNLQRRRPGQHGDPQRVVSVRSEEDMPQILSGIFADKTLGTPIALLVYNKDQRSQDYDQIAHQPRPGHADDVWREKFTHVDHRGGGRASGRETLSRVMAGSVAQMYLRAVTPETRVTAKALQIGPVHLQGSEVMTPEVIDLLQKARAEGRSYGGRVLLTITQPPASLGQPVFHKLKADLASAIMGIGAVNGIEIGAGVVAADAEGSEFHSRPEQDQYGGIRGGISTGEEIQITVSFKPTATVLDQAKAGRHDPCIIPRALPVLEAMVNLVLADHYLWRLTDKI
ncbi:MAG: chorismate synthase [Bdellovibrionaceae bacterium]|nr:chorismate synthase [Bdellovibrionales bacterium]MCB9086354.1 chorismate synthase [Pseudobdellovibrionaceae bacterium]